MKLISNKEGVCPFCGSKDLDYGCMEPEDDMVYYPWTCSHCGHEGEEWYTMKFDGHMVEDENGDMLSAEDEL